jgi:UDP-N-acetylmuramyl pentapeptide phosphotransferase/UDP-N-acetylglucosamine-1-phosphate transferase
MREAVIAILVAAFVALWTRLTLRNISHQPLLRRKNFLGEEIVGSAGLAFVGSSVLGWLLLCWRGFMDWHEGGQLMFAALWFGSLGLLDDLAGDVGAKGWRGHLTALFRQKKVTTGFIKLVGGGIGAIFLSAWLFSANVPLSIPRLSIRWLFLLVFGTVLIALSANTLNLLDVRPSRALKGFWALTFVGLLVSDGKDWWSLLPLLAGTMAYAPADFRRQAMMGDAGSNPLGACFGVWVLNHWMPPSFSFVAVELWVLLAIFVALQVYAECRSLTEDIKRVPPLRWLDELGVKK